MGMVIDVTSKQKTQLNDPSCISKPEGNMNWLTKPRFLKESGVFSFPLICDKGA